jgi:Zn finger protein HypA/HybF involved in hydrogenase expression
VKQRSKGRGSHGAKATHKAHARCAGCGKHVSLERLIDGVCGSCRGGAGRVVEKLRAADETFRPQKP